MATLDEYKKLSNDDLISGIFTNIITADELMPFLQFRSTTGQALVYNRENVLPTASVFTVGSTLVDTEPTFTKKTATLKEIYVQSPLDRFISQTLNDTQSPEATLFASMSKALGRKLANLMIKGEPESASMEFEGLDSLVRADTRMMAMDDGVVDGPGTVETELTLDRLDAMIDLVEGKVGGLIMNKDMRRKVTALSRASGSGVVMDNIEMFGHQIRTYNGIPIIVNDYITSAEQYNDSSTWPSSTATTIFAVIFGEGDEGHSVIHNGEILNPDLQRIGIKQDKNEDLFRLVIYVEAVIWSAKMVAALGGIDSTA